MSFKESSYFLTCFKWIYLDLLDTLMTIMWTSGDITNYLKTFLQLTRKVMIIDWAKVAVIGNRIIIALGIYFLKSKGNQ